MPSQLNEILLEHYQDRFSDMGSCLVVSFDKLTVEQAVGLRSKFREAGIDYQVVKNRLAVRAFEHLEMDMHEAFEGKCGVVVSPE